MEIQLDQELIQSINEVLSIIKTYDEELKDCDMYTELNDIYIDRFLNENNIETESSIRKQLKTPYSIAKFLLLAVEADNLIKKVSKELETILDKKIVSWYIYKNFSNQVIFTKEREINSEEKPQDLLVKYRIDTDSDKIIYTIKSGNWGFDIDIYNLKQLLEGKRIQSIDNSYTQSDFVSKMTENSLLVSANGLEIKISRK